MKSIKIPKFLHDIHGESPTLDEILITYVAAIFSAATVYWLCLPYGISVWHRVLLIIIAADIGAGVVANYTGSTNLYYSQNPRSRMIFIISHLLHPAVFCYALGTLAVVDAVVVTYTVCGSFVINQIKDTRNQEKWAAFFVVCGFTLLSLFADIQLLKFWFYGLFMVKLLLAFAVRRHKAKE